MSPVFTSFIGAMRSAVMSEQMSQLWDYVVFFYIPRLSLSHRVRQYSWSLALNPVQVKPLASHR